MEHTYPRSERAAQQHLLSDFLYAELLHTLGSYRYASDKLAELRRELGDPEADAGSNPPLRRRAIARARRGLRGTRRPLRPADSERSTLRHSIERAQQCNEHLRDGMHRPPGRRTAAETDRRYPSPVDEIPESPDHRLLLDVAKFYALAERALEIFIEADCEELPSPPPGHELGERLGVIHDPHRQGRFSRQYRIELQKGRLARMRYRRGKILELLPPEMRRREEELGEARLDPESPRFQAILLDHLGAAGTPGTPLHLTIFKALTDAHMWMHIAEHRRAQTFGKMLTEIPETDEEIRETLYRAVALNTFVHFAGRSVPWVFAEDEEECKRARENYEEACRILTPTYCMWIGTHLQLIALQRRAYSWWTLGHRDRAYGDFHKLTRLLSALRQQVGQRAARVPGTKTLIEGLTGIAEHHIGRIYRGQHAHRVALKYFNRASAHLEGWEGTAEIGPILKNSRWRLNLLVSQAKASYELGRVKTSLLYYARAWRAFLQLAESESHTTANTEVADALIKWLKTVEKDPELSKVELSRRIEPLVNQFRTVHSPEHLRLAASDIMMRLGHLLFILKLPPVDWLETEKAEDLPSIPDYELAHRCLRQAASLDPTSTLIAADLLKIRYRWGEEEREQRSEEDLERVDLREHWPSGGGRFEEAARIVEYILQRWLLAADEERQPPIADCDSRARAQIARSLLGSFLAHTDSSNVKLAQVYRYLMQEPRRRDPDATDDTPTLDVVCLRRYSSFFPFLPRPAAFRALGGGYLVHVRSAGQAFGIAVDPGPDFLDNLYRCGYALADIQMIVLTHDHADHMTSVDAMLALMGIRMRLGDPTFQKSEKDDEDRCLAIVGNKSICERYQFYNEPDPVRVEENPELKENPDAKPEVKAPRKDAVRVMSFGELQKILEGEEEAVEQEEKGKIVKPPEGLRIEPIQTVDHTDATGNVAQGFLLSLGDASKVLFTSDTGRPHDLSDECDEGEQFRPEGELTLKEAASKADVVVAHLSSVPLRELRALARLEPDFTDPDMAAFAELWKQASEQAQAERRKRDKASEQDGEDGGGLETNFLLRQLQFGFRSASRDRGNELAVSPLSPIAEIKEQSEKHLYLTGLLDLAEHMAESHIESEASSPPLLLLGELREELGTFRTRIASHLTEDVFARKWEECFPGDKSDVESRPGGTALTADIGLKVRLPRPGGETAAEPKVGAAYAASVLCTTCDLDNDLIAVERFHSPAQIREVCVKGENEGVFYNCLPHDPGKRPEQLWVESVERYDVFGDREGPW